MQARIFGISALNYSQLEVATAKKLILIFLNDPLPGALPLFGGGLGVLALLARRSKRKGVVKA